MRLSGTVRTRVRWVALFSLAAVVATATASAGEPADELLVYSPVADAHVSAARPLTNFGRSTSLHVDSAPKTRAFLRFRVRKPRGNVASVTLLLWATSGPRARYAVRRVTGNEWKERRLTHANAPRPSREHAPSGPVQRGAWNAVDVTELVSFGGREEVSLAITTRSTRELAFASRESRWGPRLVVRLENGDEDVPAPPPQN